MYWAFVLSYLSTIKYERQSPVKADCILPAYSNFFQQIVVVCIKKFTI